MPLLQVENVTKYFSSQQMSWKVLDGISFSVEKGDIFGIIGGSGAGKSTLMRCISSLDSLFSGTILLEKEPFPFDNPKALKQKRQKIGMIFQHYHLLESRTVEKNIALPLELEGISSREIEARVRELLDFVGLFHKKTSYPATLSGGEKQRVAIARALVSKPDLLLCDEATAALDPKTTQDILNLLKKLNQQLGLTLLLITHEMDVVRHLCNKVAVMDRGQILEQGDVVEVFSFPKVPLTKQLVQNSPHELDLSSLRKQDPSLLFIKLHFKGEITQKPLLSVLISELGVEVNILSGWIDHLNHTPIGSLTVALKGPKIQQALDFFRDNHVGYEVIV